MISLPIMKVVAHPLKWSASQYKMWPSPGIGQLPNIRCGPPLEIISLSVMKVVAHPLKWSASHYKMWPSPGNDQLAYNESCGPPLEMVSFPI